MAKGKWTKGKWTKIMILNFWSKIIIGCFSFLAGGFYFSLIHTCK